MAQIRNKFDIENSIYDEKRVGGKQLPNTFEATDEIKPILGLSMSLLLHMIFAFVLVVVTFVQGLVFPHLPKPELPNKNIEFKLVQNRTKPPIDKNTKNRSDRDSQAGGKHDPKRIVSEPSPKPSTQTKKVTPSKTQQQPKKVVKQEPKKPVQKQVQKQSQPQKVVQKPQPVKPAPAKTITKPTVKPMVATKPSVVPSAPKVATAPKSPFVVPTPSVKAPVGSTYKPATTSSSTLGGNTGSASAPAPKFSTSGGNSASSNSSNGGQYASRGSYGGYGSGGNPSPGNPNGAPGIDALRQPNWGPYMKNLEQRIKRNWTPPKGDSSKRVVITFTIARDGRLLSAKVTKSSGVPLADRAAMSAVELTAPFQPLPPEFKGQSVPIEFTFDYNVINSILR